MFKKRNIHQYRRHLERLSYPEYAYTDSKDSEEVHTQQNCTLDLSLWNDTMPAEIFEVAKSAILSAGSYHLTQDADLVNLMAHRLKYAASQISIVAGADDGLRIAAQYCIRPGTKVLIPVPSFGRYEYHAYINEATTHYLRFDAYPYEIDVTKVADYVNKKRIECIFLASPNNPTGHALSSSAIRYLLDSTRAALILDESLLTETEYSTYANLTKRYENLFVCGSFSKLYGLAGLRIGYLVVHESNKAGIASLISPFETAGVGVELAKYMLRQKELLSERVKDFKAGIVAVKGLQSPVLRVSSTSAPVALIELVDQKRKLYTMLRASGIMTLPANEFVGLEKANAVRIIIRNRQDISCLQRTLQRIL